MIRTMFAMLSLAMTLSCVAPAMAGDCAGSPGCGCHVQCPECSYYCKVEAETEKVKHHCWEVDCKPICVPRVKLPWECGCEPKCAYVKKVHVLKMKEYECEKCKYTFTPVEIGCCNDGCCNSGCGAGCAGGCAAGCDPACGAVALPVAPADCGGAPVNMTPVEPQPATPSADVPPAPVAEGEARTGQLPGWFESAKTRSARATSVLPAKFLRAAKARSSK
ncbi:MAG: hypothetical protein KDA92_16345 [Planctomycetales bacterium]|nr:hypothetical protein [Planctomycetales bacterium]